MMATIDEYQGVGGAYIYDPKTGTRKPAPAVVSEPAPAPKTKPEVTSDATVYAKDSDSDKD